MAMTTAAATKNEITMTIAAANDKHNDKNNCSSQQETQQQ